MSATLVANSETRSRILATALELIAEKGFAATTTRELSERLGFTKAGLYYHFRTKEDLLVALVEPGIAQFRELLNRPLRADRAGRRKLLDGYVTVVLDNLNLSQVLSREPAVGHIDRLRSLTQPLYAELIDRLLSGKNLDAAAVARAYVALGGIHAALLNHLPDANLDDVRRGAFAGACGALGI